MRFLIHGINYAPEVTGVGKYTGAMGEWLVARGHEVRVVTAPPYYPAWRVKEGYSARAYRRDRVAGADVWRCPLWVPAKPSGIKRLLHLASFAASSFPIMLRQVLWRPEIVVLIEPPLFCAPQAWLTARLCGTKVWLHIQDFELDAAVGLRMLSGQQSVVRLLRKMERLLLRRASRISTITEAMRQHVARKGIPEERTHVLPNWADVKLVQPVQRDNQLRREFGARSDDVLVLYAGNMGEKQGLDLILDAADRLRERAKIRFVMVGEGTAREGLERAAKQRGLNNVRFFPVQPLERLPLMLAAGDIHVVVQRREAADLVMPSKLTNILASGRPSVATADSNTTLYDILNRCDCGMTTTPGNVEELVTAIVELAADTRMRERLGRNARRYAETYLDKDRILSEFEQKVQELVKDGV